jgi:ribosome-associated translation inhibitor RaiA
MNNDQDVDMQIQVNTDRTFEGSEAREQWARDVVEGALQRYADQATRVEVHLSHDSGSSGAPDQRCTMEARLAGHAPVAVTHHAAEVDAAVNGAAHKLARALEHAQGRANKHAHDAREVLVDGETDDGL